MRVLILANNDVGLYKFRKELLEALLSENEVHISLPYGEFVDDMIEMGCIYHNIEFDRHGTNPIKELGQISYYKKLIKEIAPDVVLTYTIKPNVYGGMACTALKVPYLCNITGLGITIENKGIMQKLSLALYRLGLRKAHKVFFQNQRNLEFMLNHKVVNGEYHVLPGSGVNLQNFSLVEYPPENENINFLFIGRVMKDKGVDEFLSMAKQIKALYPNTNFDIVGMIDGDYEQVISSAVDDGYINYHGQQSDVKPFIKKSHCVVLPSYHEGMANVLLEAAASGRPVIATDIAGCRETFDDGVTGYDCKARSAESLIDAVERFIKLPYGQKAQMGKNGRKKVEQQFDRQIVIDIYLKEINNIKERELK
ncbi:MAG: glycosyltransferase family 4 protein [Oscillospiraceae bacterium]|nr:glycosyltransferase family 4 protein [Oscillospiraceae bacterium]